jgi:Fe2+ or Zn2+ uptake regulation protein
MQDLARIRHAVLGHLYERQGLALTAKHITESLNDEGTKYTPEMVSNAIGLLEGLGYVTTSTDPLSPQLKRHQISAQGILFKEAN